MTTATRRAESTTQRTLETIRHLYATRRRAVSTVEIEACSELALSVVQDSLKRLMNSGEITRPGRGLYVPVAQHQAPRPISQTWLPDGVVKIEIGDNMLALTPMEHRALVRMLGGVTAEAAQMAAESVALQQIAVQGAQIARLAQTMNERCRRAPDTPVLSR